MLAVERAIPHLTGFASGQSQGVSVMRTEGGADERGLDSIHQSGLSAGCDECAGNLAKTVEDLVQEHHATVYRYAYWLTRCPSSAEDIAQEVYVRAFRALHTLRDPSAARSWLLTITRNEFARWCRKIGPRPSAEVETQPEPVAETAGNLVSTDWVEHGMRELSDEFRIVVLMFYFEHLSYAEIAERLSLPMGTVMSRLNRGRAHLKLALERLAEPKRSADASR